MIKKLNKDYEDVKNLSRIVYDTVYLQDLLIETSKLLSQYEQLKILNIGCGSNIIKGGVNLDILRLKGVNIVVDIRNGLPFKENSFDLVIAFNILEHLTFEEFEYVLKEMKRVCKDNSLIKIHVPYFSSESAYSTLDHKIFFAYNTFWRYRESDWNPSNPKLFSDVRIKLVWHTHKSLRIPSSIISKIVNAHYLIAMLYQHFLCWIFPMRALDVVCKVKKLPLEKELERSTGGSK